jgi:hypothetical protein
MLHMQNFNPRARRSFGIEKRPGQRVYKAGFQLVADSPPTVGKVSQTKRLQFIARIT